MHSRLLLHLILHAFYLEKQSFGIIGRASTEALIGNVFNNNIHSDNFNKQVITSEISLWHFLDHFKIQITWRQQWWMELQVILWGIFDLLPLSSSFTFVFYAEIGILPRVFIRQQTLKSFLGLISAYMFILLKLHNFKYLIFPIFSFNFGGSVLHCCALNSIHPRD